MEAGESSWYTSPKTPDHQHNTTLIHLYHSLKHQSGRITTLTRIPLNRRRKGNYNGKYFAVYTRQRSVLTWYTERLALSST
jgi:hypothetical protein